MEKFKIQNKEVYLIYNHGWLLYDGIPTDKNSRLLYKFPHTSINWNKAMSFRNFIKFYWWKIKQWLFWHNVHKPIGEWLRKKTKLNDTPYMGDYEKAKKY